jgi:hypothetical protein
MGLVGSLHTAGSHYVPICVTYHKAKTLLGLKVFRHLFEKKSLRRTAWTLQESSRYGCCIVSVNETINKGSVMSVLFLLWCKVRKLGRERRERGIEIRTFQIRN